MNGRKVPFNPKTGEGIAFPTGGKPHKKVGLHPLPRIENTKPLPRQYTRDDSKSTRPTNSKMRHIMPDDRALDFSTKPEQKKKRSYIPKDAGIRKLHRREKTLKQKFATKKDSLLENAMEAIPILGSALSIDDVARAAYNTRNESAVEKVNTVTPELLGALPAGKTTTRGLNMVPDTTKELAVRYGTQVINATDTATDIYQDNVKPSPAFQKLMNMGK